MNCGTLIGPSDASTGRGVSKGSGISGSIVDVKETSLLDEAVVLEAGGGRALGKLLERLLPSVTKAVNSNLPHAVERAVERGIFKNPKEASAAIKSISEEIGRTGFPKGTIPDPAHADRVLVPIGNGGRVVYQIAKNETAKLKTVLIDLLK
jgi:hypothetical protein